MIPYTTPQLALTVEDADLTGCDVYVSIYAGTNITKKGEDVTATLVGNDTLLLTRLTQAESGRLRKGGCKIQVNWIDENGHRDATEQAEIEVGSNLLQEVIYYGGDN